VEERAIAPHQVHRKNTDMKQYHYQLTMTKPLGYYTSYTPGDEGLLAEMQEAWGSQFEALTNVERTWMIMKIGENLCAGFDETTDDNSLRDGIEKAVERIWNNELSIGDQLRLIEALVHQVISS
jgi:hypothetical protein